ncbi:MAG: YceI family protein, partial [Pseudomonadota bacterium]
MNVRTVLLASTIVALASAPALAGTIYNTDPGHTEVRFGWNHAGVSMQHGEFTGIEGTLDFDPENVEASTLSVVIDPASISTGVEALDGH